MVPLIVGAAFLALLIFANIYMFVHTTTTKYPAASKALSCLRDTLRTLIIFFIFPPITYKDTGRS